jgi:O-acetyl-ADP-ribose deacetylase (regulator of RNase III)
VTNLYESWSDRLATLRTGVFGAPRATLARAASTSCSYRLPNAQGIGTIVFTVSGRDNSRLFCSTFNVV